MENTHEDIKKDISPDRLDYYAEIKKSGMAPLWENLHHMLTPEPKVKSLPHHWDYSSVRKLLLNSANLISAAEAERRVLMLENPGLPGNCSITESLFAGLQLIMPVRWHLRTDTRQPH